MSLLQRRFKIALLQQNRAAEEVAKSAGLRLTSLRNIINGGACSDPRRQRITNGVGAVLWDDVPVQREMYFPAQTEILCLTLREAKEAEIEFRGYVRRRGRTIIFIRKTPITISFGADDDETSVLPRATNLAAAAGKKRTPTPVANTAASESGSPSLASP